jgi:hypothetical protein
MLRMPTAHCRVRCADTGEENLPALQTRSQRDRLTSPIPAARHVPSHGAAAAWARLLGASFRKAGQPCARHARFKACNAVSIRQRYYGGVFVRRYLSELSTAELPAPRPHNGIAKVAARTPRCGGAGAQCANHRKTGFLRSTSKR